MVSNIFIVNKKDTIMGLFLIIYCLAVIFEHVLYLVIMYFLLIVNVYLLDGVVPKRATTSVWMCVYHLLSKYGFNKVADMT